MKHQPVKKKKKVKANKNAKPEEERINLAFGDANGNDDDDDDDGMRLLSITEIMNQLKKRPTQASEQARPKITSMNMSINVSSIGRISPDASPKNQTQMEISTVKPFKFHPPKDMSKFTVLENAQNEKKRLFIEHKQLMNEYEAAMSVPGVDEALVKEKLKQTRIELKRVSNITKGILAHNGNKTIVTLRSGANAFNEYMT